MIVKYKKFDHIPAEDAVESAGDEYDVVGMPFLTPGGCAVEGCSG
jgi:hypothetical protein